MQTNANKKPQTRVVSQQRLNTIVQAPNVPNVPNDLFTLPSAPSNNAMTDMGDYMKGLASTVETAMNAPMQCMNTPLGVVAQDVAVISELFEYSHQTLCSHAAYSSTTVGITYAGLGLGINDSNMSMDKHVSSDSRRCHMTIVSKSSVLFKTQGEMQQSQPSVTYMINNSLVAEKTFQHIHAFMSSYGKQVK